MRTKSIWVIGVAVAVGVITSLTLTPMPGQFPTGCQWCLIRGERGVADAISNVLLFMPAGFAAAFLIRRKSWVVGFGTLLSLWVESAQYLTPGRDPSPADVVFNALGAAAGVATAAAITWATATSNKLAARVSIIAAMMLTAMILTTGWLGAPDFPPGRYYGQWTPDLGIWLEPYGGRVVDASIGDHPVPSGRMQTSLVRMDFLAGAPLNFRVVAGPAPSRLAPIVSVFDDSQRRILLVGADHDDMILETRTRAESLRLDGIPRRVESAFDGVQAGDTLSIRAWRDEDRSCILVGVTQHCMRADGPGSGWRFLGVAAADFPRTAAVADSGWLALWAMCVGLFLRRRWECAVALVLLAGALTVVPPLVGLRPANPWDAAAVILGLMGGAAVMSRLRARRARMPSGLAD